METWLKLIGSSDKPLSKWEENYIGFRKERKPGIRPGDRMFLYAPGGSKKIFALAEATSDPEVNPEYNSEIDGSCYWNINVKYEINLPVNSGIHIDEIITEKRNLLKSIQRQSHIRLSPKESKLALEKLHEAQSI